METVDEPTHVYCVTDRPYVSRWNSIRSLPIDDNVTLVVETKSNEEALVRPSDNPTDAAIARALRRHRINDEAMIQTGACLPVRFGFTAPSMRAAAAAFVEQARDLADALANVRDKREWCVKATIHESELQRQRGSETNRSRSAGPGAAYLASKRRSLPSKQALRPVSELREACLRFTDDARHLPAPKREAQQVGLFAAAYLVRTEREPDFRAALDRFASRFPRVGVVVTGPWPPYNFCGENCT